MYLINLFSCVYICLCARFQWAVVSSVLLFAYSTEEHLRVKMRPVLPVSLNKCFIRTFWVVTFVFLYLTTPHKVKLHFLENILQMTALQQATSQPQSKAWWRIYTLHPLGNLKLQVGMTTQWVTSRTMQMCLTSKTKTIHHNHYQRTPEHR